MCLFFEKISALKVAPIFAVILEAIRIYVAPAQKKIRDGRVPTGFVSAGRKPRKKQGEVAITYIPRVRVVRNEDMDTGGGARPVVPTGITHGLHQVAGFVRQLPIGQHASATARQNAEDHGLALPDEGMTFVSPHTRGHGGGKRVFRIVKER
ncbi:MAG: hypothetical protein LBR38_01020 [Synergistaceae bacterium]|jgi:hypothetical protein|nr:hypothetical protein [Synergistaceae bacterium]